MADYERGNLGSITVGKALKYLAGACAVAGLLVTATGALRFGALLFASAVVLFGAGGLLGGVGDRAVDFVLLFVGAISMIGVAGHLLTGL